MPSNPAWWQGLLAMFYRGITGEIMVRLFVMTLIVWVLAKVTHKERDNIPSVYFWLRIVLATLLFGIGHFPANVGVFSELNILVVVRAILLNGILGIWFGFPYWKKGLEYAIIAHTAADVCLHVVLANFIN